MISEWNWISFKDAAPEGSSFVFFYDNDDKCIGIFHGDDLDVSSCKDDFWCYVYIPDPPKPKRNKLKSSEVLCNLSNNYILMLEERIERLEKHLEATQG